MEKSDNETETITISKCAWWQLEAYREANEDTLDKAIMRMSKNASKWEDYAVNLTQLRYSAMEHENGE
jgi:hypothetical protein